MFNTDELVKMTYINNILKEQKNDFDIKLLNLMNEKKKKHYFNIKFILKNKKTVESHAEIIIAKIIDLLDEKKIDDYIYIMCKKQYNYNNYILYNYYKIEQNNLIKNKF
jgi:hypothetical protein